MKLVLFLSRKKLYLEVEVEHTVQHIVKQLDQQRGGGGGGGGGINYTRFDSLKLMH